MAKENTPNQSVSATPKEPQQKPTSKKSPVKGNRAQIGGTAVPGAKSLQPKEIASTTNPSQQQQSESYNRDMRRRMQHLGTGPSNRNTPQEQRKKRLERRKQRLEEERERLRRSNPAGNVALGRKSLYFILAVAVLVILLIVVFVILRNTHALG